MIRGQVDNPKAIVITFSISGNLGIIVTSFFVFLGGGVWKLNLQTLD